MLSWAMNILITAGPTREPIDAVRFISNRSSGKTGLAIAVAAAQTGHRTTLLLGPGACDSTNSKGLPPSVAGYSYRTYRFESSAELKQLLEAHWPDHDVLIMAAAVADYRPVGVTEGKIPRSAQQELVLRLSPTPDLVALMAAYKKPHQRVIAFALEEAGHLEKRAIDKMKRKGVDAIVANPLGTMEHDSITPVWLTDHGDRDTPIPQRVTKQRFAEWLIGKVEGLNRGV